jgi:hypothetical protein
VAFGIVLFLLLFGLLMTTKPHRIEQIWKERIALLLPVAWTIVPIGLFLILGLFREANLKFLLPAQIGFALWLARGIWVLWEGKIIRRQRNQWTTRLSITRLAAALALVWLTFNLFSGLDTLYNDPAFRRDDYRAIVQFIESSARPGDAIILDAPNQQEVFTYYYHGDLPIYALPEGLGGDDAVTQAAVEDIIAGYDRVFAVFWGEAERDPLRIVESTLNAESFEVSDVWYGDVRLVRYVILADEYTVTVETAIQFGEHISLVGYALNSDSLTVGDVLQIQLQWTTDELLDTRYVVTVQLLNPDGTLAAQHDSEPGGGLSLTTTWEIGEIVMDNHGLVIIEDLTQTHYTLIIGLYDVNNPQARLLVGDLDYAELGTINIIANGG